MSDQAGNDDEDSCRVKIIGAKIGTVCAKYDDLFSSARIFKVSESIREQNKSAYTPRLIAIGPLHRKDEHLQTPMQDIKVHYPDALISQVAKKIGDDGKNHKVPTRMFQKS